MSKTHFDDNGNPKMVDVSSKGETKRIAIATASIYMKKETIALIREKKFFKGDVLAVSTVGGIMGAKKTSELIPMCHNISLSGASIDFELFDDHIEIFAAVHTSSHSGVEMEALTACTISALTIYDMCKSGDNDIYISNVMLLEKIGGRSGHYKRYEEV